MPVERGWRAERHETVTSTMDIAAERSEAGAPPGIVIVAEEQTAGRGRQGRHWYAPRGTCLLFTVLLRPDISVAQDQALSRTIGERVGEAILEVTGLQPEIKDPNDLLIDGLKVAGILCQTSIRGDELEHLLVGIGINVNIPERDLPLSSATSLLVETGDLVDRDELLKAILRQLTIVPGLTVGVEASA